MTKRGKYDKDPPYHRLTLDVDKSTYDKLKGEAKIAERTPSKQAKFILMEHLLKNLVNKTRKST